MSDDPAAGHPDDIFHALAERPGRFDLFQALRRIEAAHPHQPRLGDALRPGDEPVRFGGEPALNFAPTAISRLERRAGATPRLVQRVLDFFGPNGALPTHLTEYARERQIHHGDRSFAAFVDMLLHRFGLLFYRAWARSHPVVGMDRPSEAPVVRHVGALVGIAEPTQRGRDALGDHAKLFFAGRLARGVRDADGLASWIQLHFGVPARVQQFCGQWMPLDPAERTRLSHRPGIGQALGRGALLGGQVWDVQHKFRIVLGPLAWDDFQAFLPQGDRLRPLQAMVRQYVGHEFAWDVQLALVPMEVLPVRLGRTPDPARPGETPDAALLGRSTWLGSQRPRQRADQLVINVDSLFKEPLAPSQAPAHLH